MRCQYGVENGAESRNPPTGVAAGDGETERTVDVLCRHARDMGMLRRALNSASQMPRARQISVHAGGFLLRPRLPTSDRR